MWYDARKSTLALACAAAAASLSPHAVALKFNWGELEGTFNSNFSVGASWRTEDPSLRVVSPGNTDGKGRAASSVTDDGNLNYDEGDMYSLLFKGVHDFDLTNGAFGVFTRFKYWYDHELAEGNVPHGHAANGYIPDQELDLSDFEPLAQEQGFEFLDYYVYGSIDIADKPVELRAGNMVLSWGENTFIQNGVNVINPFDVTALRKPGSEIKEALLPVGMLYGSMGVTRDLSVELFYQYDWERTILDECGTYWNSGDPYGGGCDFLTASASPSDLEQLRDDFIVPRAPDDTPSDSGQWGIAARYFIESLNATEVGAYYVNYHSRTPIFSAVNPTENFGQPFILGSNPQYIFEFPEDIEVYALTFATNLGFWALSGELSYRPDFPLQINQTQILQAAALGSFAEWSTVAERSAEAGPGGRVQGYDDVEYTQFQMTFIRFFEQVMGASRLSFAAEVGATFLDGLDDDQVYGRSSTYGDYSDVFAGINLTPNVAWSHDVEGNSPPPNFIEDRMAFSVGVRADYLSRYQADLSYTTFFGADYNDQEDRDFISLSFSVAF